MSLRSKLKTTFFAKDSVQGQVPIQKIPDHFGSVKLSDLDFDLENWPRKEMEVIYADIEVVVFETWEENHLETMSYELRNVIHACNFQVKVEFGGIFLYIERGCGEYFEETLAAFKTMNLLGAAEILTQFKSLFDHEYVPKDMEERSVDLDVILGKMENEESPFESWDKYLFENRDEFKEKVIAYVRGFIAESEV